MSASRGLSCDFLWPTDMVHSLSLNTLAAWGVCKSILCSLEKSEWAKSIPLCGCPMEKPAFASQHQEVAFCGGFVLCLWNVVQVDPLKKLLLLVFCFVPLKCCVSWSFKKAIIASINYHNFALNPDNFVSVPCVLCRCGFPGCFGQGHIVNRYNRHKSYVYLPFSDSACFQMNTLLFNVLKKIYLQKDKTKNYSSEQVVCGLKQFKLWCHFKTATLAALLILKIWRVKTPFSQTLYTLHCFHPNRPSCNNIL